MPAFAGMTDEGASGLAPVAQSRKVFLLLFLQKKKFFLKSAYAPYRAAG